MEGDTTTTRQATGRKDFNPRPPHGGRRAERTQNASYTAISIHALRMEGDVKDGDSTVWQANFNPRPPHGGRLKAIIRL